MGSISKAVESCESQQVLGEELQPTHSRLCLVATDLLRSVLLFLFLWQPLGLKLPAPPSTVGDQSLQVNLQREKEREVRERKGTDRERQRETGNKNEMEKDKEVEGKTERKT